MARRRRCAISPELLAGTGTAGQFRGRGVEPRRRDSLRHRQHRPVAGVRCRRHPLAEVTRLDPSRKEVFHAGPDFLPDGRHFLYRPHRA